MTSAALFHSFFLMKEIKVDCLLCSILFVQFSFFEVQTSVLFSPVVLLKVLPLILPSPLRQSH